ncbi:Crp/Fnr family transcriptional regulator [Streptomyces sp. NPDC058000]|uniref:Crp/Fnr family transcriptional regulator n=1 Tax=Streptomyces sp. NPDC058000 TaxID=3346299 RepID=UPI0036EC2417
MNPSSHVSAPAGFRARMHGVLYKDSVRASTVTVDRNQNAYSCGDQDRNVYYVESGQIKTVMFSRSGKECLLRIYTPGDLFGELCSLGGVRAESATAMRDSIVRRVPYGQFLTALTEEGLVDAFINHLTRRLAEQQQSITHLVTVDSEQRLGEILLDLARKLGKGDRQRSRIEERITHEELSGMVGTTRSRVGHFLKHFRDVGLVEVTPESHLVVDQRRLAAYLETRSA